MGRRAAEPRALFQQPRHSRAGLIKECGWSPQVLCPLFFASVDKIKHHTWSKERSPVGASASFRDRKRHAQSGRRFFQRAQAAAPRKHEGHRRGFVATRASPGKVPSPFEFSPVMRDATRLHQNVAGKCTRKTSCVPDNVGAVRDGWPNEKKKRRRNRMR